MVSTATSKRSKAFAVLAAKAVLVSTLAVVPTGLTSAQAQTQPPLPPVAGGLTRTVPLLGLNISLPPLIPPALLPPPPAPPPAPPPPERPPVPSPNPGIAEAVSDLRERLKALTDDVVTPGTLNGLLAKLEEAGEDATRDVCGANQAMRSVLARLEQLLGELGGHFRAAEVLPVVQDLLGRGRDLLGLLGQLLPDLDPCKAVGSPPPTFVVDPRVQPAQGSLRPLDDGGPSRPLARVADDFGSEADFVQNELLVQTDDDAALEGVVSRWNGQLVKSTPGRPGLPATHLLRIDASAARLADLVVDVRKLDPASRGLHRVSSLDGLRLLAVGADEAAGGLTVGVNWVTEAHQFTDGVSNEAPTACAADGSGPCGTNDTTYSQNAFGWPYMSPGNPTQNIGGAEAWRALELAGRLQNRVPLAVVDGGFSSTAFNAGTTNTDFPRWSAPQDAEDDVDESSWDSNPSRAWHGTTVASVAAGDADNNYGAAGAAGPVANVLIVDVEGDIFTGMAGAYDAINDGARIVNFSWGSQIPATLSFSAIPFSNFTALYRHFGVLFFSSAGNTQPGEGPQDVDNEHCFIACWEATFHMPCENVGMVCVGGLNQNGENRSNGSYFGYEWCGGLCDVDIFGPFWTYVTPDPVNVPGVPNQARLATGTSYASPFVAGVAALVWAANPGLHANDVEHILYTTANPSPDAGTQRYVNALAAVLRALGGNVPPLVQITQPTAGATVDYGVTMTLQASVQDYEEGACSCVVRWSSDVDGPLGTSYGSGSTPVTFRSPGPRTITAQATDSGGATGTATVSINVINTPPTVTVHAPNWTGQLHRGAAYTFRAEVQDPNAADPCRNAAELFVYWTSSDSRDRMLDVEGCKPTTSFPTTGTRTITAVATDAFGAQSSASVTVTVIDPPQNSPPVATISSPRDGYTVYFYNTVQLRGQATEPDGDQISYRWTARCANGPEEQIATGPEATWRPTPDDPWFVPGCNPRQAIIALYASDKDGVGSNSVTVPLNWAVP